MQIQKKIEDIKFTDCDVWGTVMPVSEDIVMASAAGWYVGAICKDPDCGGMIVPWIVTGKQALLYRTHHNQ